MHEIDRGAAVDAPPVRTSCLFIMVCAAAWMLFAGVRREGKEGKWRRGGGGERRVGGDTPFSSSYAQQRQLQNGVIHT